jgi:hypothetical protein
MPSPYRREELIADTATLVYLLSGLANGENIFVHTVIDMSHNAKYEIMYS